jgi:hypothetical protein
MRGSLNTKLASRRGLRCDSGRPIKPPLLFCAHVRAFTSSFRRIGHPPRPWMIRVQHILDSPYEQSSKHLRCSPILVQPHSAMLAGTWSSATASGSCSPRMVDARDHIESKGSEPLVTQVERRHIGQKSGPVFPFRETTRGTPCGRYAVVSSGMTPYTDLIFLNLSQGCCATTRFWVRDLPACPGGRWGRSQSVSTALHHHTVKPLTARTGRKWDGVAASAPSYAAIP